MKGSLESRVKAVVSDFFNLPRAQVRLDFVFVDDLGADALDLIELIYAFEAEFGIVIPKSEADILISVRDVIAWLRTQNSREFRLRRSGAGAGRPNLCYNIRNESE